VFQLPVGTFECTPLLKETKITHVYHASTGPVYHLHSILVSFQEFLMYVRHGELPHNLQEIRSGSSLFPSEFLGGEKAGASFPVPWSYGENRRY